MVGGASRTWAENHFRQTMVGGEGRFLLQAAERRAAAAGRAMVRLDCVASNTRLNAYYLDLGYRVVGHKAGKTQPAVRLSRSR